MRSLTYYIAATIDGFIAGPDRNFDFFPFEGDSAAAIMTQFPPTRFEIASERTFDDGVQFLSYVQH